MGNIDGKQGIYIPPGRHPWPHEMHTANILSLAGHYVEFLPETILKNADICLDGAVEYEIIIINITVGIAGIDGLENSTRNLRRPCAEGVDYWCA